MWTPLWEEVNFGTKDLTFHILSVWHYVVCVYPPIELYVKCENILKFPKENKKYADEDINVCKIFR